MIIVALFLRLKGGVVGWVASHNTLTWPRGAAILNFSGRQLVRKPFWSGADTPVLSGSQGSGCKYT